MYCDNLAWVDCDKYRLTMSHNDDKMYTKEVKAMFEAEFNVLPELRSNSDLLATLDDTVQAMCGMSHEEWGADTSPAHRYFEAIKRELSKRLGGD